MAPDDEGVRITLRDVWQELRSFGTRVEQVVVRLEAVADHEDRIRRLERWRYSLPASLFASAAALLVALIGGPR